MKLLLFNSQKGTYTVKRCGIVLENLSPIAEGDNLKLTATANDGNTFMYWSVNGVHHSCNPYRFTVGCVDLMIYAEFCGDNVQCFLEDAPVLTPNGYRNISDLKAGDLITSPKGTALAIRSLKKQLVEPCEFTHPYIIPRGRFGATQNLQISPHHQVKDGDWYVEARFMGLERDYMTEPFHYYNLELEDSSRDMVVAGVAVESWKEWNGVKRTEEGSLHK